jgi:mono/diheme cytochrome c family protein
MFLSYNNIFNKGFITPTVTKLATVFLMLSMMIPGCSSDSSDSSGTPINDAMTNTNNAEFSACRTEFESTIDMSISSANATQGGLLYDKWWTASGRPEPVGDHPLWAQQSTNTRTGSSTWRCKECHGWDYQGKDGVYGNQENSHYTGFPGILAANTKTPLDVFCSIRSGTPNAPEHGFSEALSTDQLFNLTAFVTAAQEADYPSGVINMTDWIGEDAVPLNAIIESGGALYTNPEIGCAGSGCHGDNGTRQSEPLGELARKNPWETQHKIRFGHPGSAPPMPAYGNPSYPHPLTLQQINDVIAYVQTLKTPEDSAEEMTPPNTGNTEMEITAENAAVIAYGGLLYDNWISEKQVGTPAEDNPVWNLQTTNTRTGAATWRCKECHGWDYKGVNGVYGNPNNSHYTGFGGLWNTEKDEAAIVEYLENGFYYAPSGQVMHNFGELLSASDRIALAKFIKLGMANTTEYFGMDAIINGSVAAFQNGKKIYAFTSFGSPSGNCELCHGIDGKGEPDLALGEVAISNPWEFVHKVRFGQPGSSMPGMIELIDQSNKLVYDLQDAIDVTQYSQSLPTQ